MGNGSEIAMNATGSPAAVADHYACRDLETTLLDALVAAGKDPERLGMEDLAPVDEFHVQGRSATVELARELALDATMRVLDVGCGLGGAARHLAKEFGCRVVGVDLSHDYCRAATGFTRRLGLDSLVTFQQGNALALPFADASFEVVWTQHAAMNIADKAGLYRELFRVLKPGGRLAIYDILAGTGGDVHFPVPWAREPSISFLATAQQLRTVLAESGFEVLIWRDTTESGRTWFRRAYEKICQQGVPPFGLQLLLGPDFRLMAHNQAANLEEDRIALIEAVVKKPGT